MKQPDRRVPSVVTLAVVVCFSLVGSMTPAIAQDSDTAGDEGIPIDLSPLPPDQIIGPFQIDDGSYEGALSYSSFLTRSGGRATLVARFGGAGNASFTLDDGVMTGDWTTTENGGLFVPELTSLRVQAQVQGQGSGEFSGSFPYSLAGTIQTQATATVGNQSGSGSDVVEIDYQLQDNVQICGQVLLNWDRSFTSRYEEIGWSPGVKSQVVVFPATGIDEIQSRLVALTDAAISAATRILEPEVSLILIVDTLLQAEALMSDIDSYPEACPLGPEFLRIITQVLRDTLNTMLDHWNSLDEGVRMLVLRKLVEVGLRGGVLGSGATDPTAAEFLRDKITNILQQTYDALIDNDSELDAEELRRTVVVADIFGYDLNPNLSNADICDGLGGC
jgi:hypothetical protein